MKITVQHVVLSSGISCYEASISIADENQEVLARFEHQFSNTHEIYAAYKIFHKAIAISHRLGATEINIITNSEPFALEMSGQHHNKHTTLYTHTHYRLRGIRIGTVTLVDGGALVAN